MLVRRRASTVVVLGMLLLVGCAGEPAVFAPSAPPSSSPPASDEELAFRAAEETYRAYVDALNEVDLADPRTFEPVFALTTGELQSSDKSGLLRYHAEGVSVSGTSVVKSVVASGSQRSGLIELAVCLDVSSVQVVDASGRSLVSEDRVLVQSLAVILERATPTDPFLISQVGGREGEPKC